MGIWLIHDLFSGADDHRCWNQQIRASYGGPSKMGTFVISLKQSKNGGIKCRWTGAGFPAVQPVRLSTSLGNLPIPSFSCLSLDGVDACKRTQGNYLWNPVILSVNLKTICSIYSSALCPWEILTFQLRLGFYKAIPGLSCVIIDLRDHLSVEKWLGNIPCNGLFHMEINHILVGKTTQRCRRTRIPPKPHPWCGWVVHPWAKNWPVGMVPPTQIRCLCSYPWRSENSEKHPGIWLWSDQSHPKQWFNVEYTDYSEDIFKDTTIRI